MNDDPELCPNCKKKILKRGTHYSPDESYLDYCQCMFTHAELAMLDLLYDIREELKSIREYGLPRKD